MYIWNLLADAATTETPWGSYILMGVMLIAVIGMMVWSSISNKKKQKEAQNMVNTLKIGDRVTTIGGVCGFVAQINDAENTFVLETGLEGNKSYVKFDKGAIYKTAPAQGAEVAAEEKKEEKPVDEVKPVEKKAKKAKKAKEEDAE